MAQTLEIAAYDVGRQDVLAAKAYVTFGEGVTNPFTSGGEGADFPGTTGTKSAVVVPAGAIVVGGFYRQISATTSLTDVHIGDGGSNNRYANNINGAAVATTSLIPTGYKYTSDDTIDIFVDAALPSQAATGLLVVEYIIDGRAAFVQK